MGSIKKLKQTEIKAYRENMLKDQDGLCALCNHEIDSKAVLDHAHYEPYKDKVRGVIHNSCNIYLGKLENSMIFQGEDLLSILRFSPAAWQYIVKDYSKADWHPHKRKSEVTAFKKLSSEDQRNHLLVKGVDPVDPNMKNQAGRVGLFKKLNAKT